MFDLYYNVSNNGDGSVSVQFYTTMREAERADKSQSESWGESSVSCLKLEIVNGIICIRERTYKNKKWQEVRKELSKSK